MSAKWPAWLKFLNLTRAGIRFVKNAIQKAGKAVTASSGVSAVYYPSKKMGFVLQLQSRTVEFVVALILERDPHILAYYDQPTGLKLKYKSRSGRTTVPITTADFLTVDTQYSVEIVEAKHRDNMASLAERSPSRYVQDVNGNWTCPPGEAAAARLGARYRIWIPSEREEVFFRNAQFLEDYFLEESPLLDPSSTQKIGNLLSANGGFLKLESLLNKLDDSSCLYRAIAMNELYFNLERDLLSRPLNSYVYLDENTATAAAHLHGTRPTSLVGVRLLEESRINWEGTEWAVIKVMDDSYRLRNLNDEVIVVSKVQMATLIDSKKVKEVQSTEYEAMATAVLRTTKPADLVTANQRMLVLSDIWQGKSPVEPPSNRTLNRWIANYKRGEQLYGNGFIGLIPNHKCKGRRGNRLRKDQRKLIKKSLKKDYKTKAAGSVYSAYVLYKARCSEKGVPPVAYRTYRRRVAAMNLVGTTTARKGKKAAYKFTAPLGTTNIPVRGERAWEVNQCDHTQLDIKLCSAITGEELGNPWLTLLTDSDSGKTFARYLTFSKPSKVAAMMVLRDCVYRHNRLPQRIVVDQGGEFNSADFEILLGATQVTKVSRPPSESKFGAQVERMIGTINTKFIYPLLGNSRALKDPRSMSRSHDPRALAIWTPEAFLEKLDEFLFDVHPNITNLENRESPESRFNRSIARSGSRPSRYIPFDENFLILSMPQPKNPTRKIHSFGIAVNGLRYWSEEIRDYAYDGNRYEVKYDPHNVNSAYIFIDKRWVELECTSPIVREYMESGLNTAFMELTARTLKAGREYLAVPEVYAKFLLNCKRNEEFLSADKELRIAESEKGSADIDAGPHDYSFTLDEDETFESFDLALEK